MWELRLSFSSIAQVIMPSLPTTKGILKSTNHYISLSTHRLPWWKFIQILVTLDGESVDPFPKHFLLFLEAVTKNILFIPSTHSAKISNIRWVWYAIFQVTNNLGLAREIYKIFFRNKKSGFLSHLREYPNKKGWGKATKVSVKPLTGPNLPLSYTTN